MSKKQDRKGHAVAKREAPIATRDEFIRSGHRLAWMFGCSGVVAVGIALFFFGSDPALENAGIFVPATALLSISLATYVVAQRPLFRQSADRFRITREEFEASSSQAMADGTTLPTISELNTRVEKTPTGPTKIVS